MRESSQYKVMAEVLVGFETSGTVNTQACADYALEATKTIMRDMLEWHVAHKRRSPARFLETPINYGPRVVGPTQKFKQWGEDVKPVVEWFGRHPEARAMRPGGMNQALYDLPRMLAVVDQIEKQEELVKEQLRKLEELRQSTTVCALFDGVSPYDMWKKLDDPI